MISSTLSKQQLLAQKSYLQARVTNYYTSNISAGDHIKFNSVVNGSGTDITLDTSTTYTSTAGVASIGRFTLKAGKTYKLYATVQGNGTTGVNATFVWYNSTANAAVSGSRAYPLSPAFSGGNGPVPEATAFITTQVDTLVELRINSVTDLNTIEGADSNDATFAVIETIEKVIPVVNSTISYIRRENGTTQGSTNTNVLIYGTGIETSGSDITYVNSASNGDSFTINTSGVYAISASARQNTGGSAIFQICVGNSIKNTTDNSDVRAHASPDSATLNRACISWTGYISAGQKVYIINSSTPSIANLNTIQITGPL